MKTTTQSEAPSERAWMQSCAWRYQVCVDSILLYDGSGVGLRKREEQNRHELKAAVFPAISLPVMNVTVE